jgi:hypothetical protein
MTVFPVNDGSYSGQSFFMEPARKSLHYALKWPQVLEKYRETRGHQAANPSTYPSRPRRSFAFDLG